MKTLNVSEVPFSPETYTFSTIALLNPNRNHDRSKELSPILQKKIKVFSLDKFGEILDEAIKLSQKHTHNDYDKGELARDILLELAYQYSPSEFIFHTPLIESVPQIVQMLSKNKKSPLDETSIHESMHQKSMFPIKSSRLDNLTEKVLKIIEGIQGVIPAINEKHKVDLSLLLILDLMQKERDFSMEEDKQTLTLSLVERVTQTFVPKKEGGEEVLHYLWDNLPESFGLLCQHLGEEKKYEEINVQDCINLCKQRVRSYFPDGIDTEDIPMVMGRCLDIVNRLNVTMNLRQKNDLCSQILHQTVCEFIPIQSEDVRIFLEACPSIISLILHKQEESSSRAKDTSPCCTRGIVSACFSRV